MHDCNHQEPDTKKKKKTIKIDMHKNKILMRKT